MNIQLGVIRGDMFDFWRAGYKSQCCDSIVMVKHVVIYRWYFSEGGGEGCWSGCLQCLPVLLVCGRCLPSAADIVIALPNARYCKGCTHHKPCTVLCGFYYENFNVMSIALKSVAF